MLNEKLMNEITIDKYIENMIAKSKKRNKSYCEKNHYINFVSLQLFVIDVTSTQKSDENDIIFRDINNDFNTFNNIIKNTTNNNHEINLFLRYVDAKTNDETLQININTFNDKRKSKSIFINNNAYVEIDLMHNKILNIVAKQFLKYYDISYVLYNDKIVFNDIDYINNNIDVIIKLIKLLINNCYVNESYFVY